jgi:Na+-translocating ferredoxin:NAD+ oxidoreductase RnfD subunit
MAWIKFESFGFKAIKTQLVVFLLFFACFVSVVDRDAGFWVALGKAVFFAVSSETIFCYFLRSRKIIVSDSSVITGVILGFVLASDQPWWLLALSGFCAVASKHLIRFRNKHLLNPAAFGILLVILGLNAKTEWHGTYLWYILFPAGMYFAQRIRKMEILASYFLVALLLFGVQAWQQKIPFTTVFGYLSYFYIFIMVIEPKTTPVTFWGKIIFGGGVAGLIFLLTQIGVSFDAELASLLVFNLTVPFLNRMPQRKGVNK